MSEDRMKKEMGWNQTGEGHCAQDLLTIRLQFRHLHFQGRQEDQSGYGDYSTHLWESLCV